jgi:alpha-amylase/alpha-mannosidase (GH57 family)
LYNQLRMVRKGGSAGGTCSRANDVECRGLEGRALRRRGGPEVDSRLIFQDPEAIMRARRQVCTYPLLQQSPRGGGWSWLQEKGRIFYQGTLEIMRRGVFSPWVVHSQNASISIVHYVFV